MGLFAASIIYSLVTLAVLSNRPLDFAIPLPLGLGAIHPVTLALAWAGTCLLLLAPYLWSFKRRLDPESMARDEGKRAIQRLQQAPTGEPPGVAELDNIVMSAFGYGDYDTFAKGLDELVAVGAAAWRLSQVSIGDSIFGRVAHIGVATIDDPRASFQVTDILTLTGNRLAGEGFQEGARQAAVAMSEVGEMAVRKDQVVIIRHICLGLASLGTAAAGRGLVSAAEETAYSLGHLGMLAARRGMDDSTRQVAASLRQIGSRAAQRRLELAAQQVAVSLWSLGGTVYLFIPASLEIVARELEMMEQEVGARLVDASYWSAPRSDAVIGFRNYYLQEVRQALEDVT